MHVADAFRAVLLDEKIDPALAAEILTLPSVNEMAELFDIIDPIAIAEVREALTRTLATELADELLAIYNAITRASTVLSMTILQNALCEMPACASSLLVKRIWLMCW
ncbi:aminopeptidase N [Escherichia coli]|uniref:Aminopeptidase N n=1 Tax=Escherichia coli TaxID=562 RepID=A0A485JH43_ECOLX|nr:aminopeptidase N [Escherichia coli]